MGFFLSPATFPLEIDLSAIVPTVATSVGALVGASKRGPLERTLVTNTKQFVEAYGIPEPGNPFHYTALGFLLRSQTLLLRRATNGALWGGVEIKSDGSGEANVGSASGCPDPENYESTPGFAGADSILAFLPPNPGKWNDGWGIQITNTEGSPEFEFDVTILEKDANDNFVPVFGPQRVSRKDKKDGFGRNMNVLDLFDPVDGIYRKYAIVVENTAQLGGDPERDVMPKPQVATLAATQGDDGAAITTGIVNLDWEEFFGDADTVSVNILLQGGLTDAPIGQKMAEIAEARRDCVAVLDIPFDKQAAVDAINWRDNTLNVDSSYAALYAPWMKIYDSYNDKVVSIPPSGHVGAVMAFTDFVNEPWFAPAGPVRGRISIRELDTNYTRGERDLLYPKGINFLRKRPGGHAVWGQKTLQVRASALDRLNVRRLLVTIEKAMVTALDNFLFDPNDRFTRTFIKNLLDGFLRNVQARRGLTDFRVVCDDSNNDGEIIDRNELHVDVYLKPVKSAEFIQLQSVITRTDASFDEVIGAAA